MLNHYAQCKRYTVHQLDFIITEDKSHLDAIKIIEEYFVSLITPKNFDGGNSENIIIQQKLAFENICVALMKHGINTPDEMTVFRFNAAIDFYEKQKTK